MGMAYITSTELLLRFDAEEIAQVAERGLPRRVTAELLTAAVAGTDLSGWSAADVEAVGKALAVIAQAIEDAQSAIDGYLSGRYGTPMATPPAVVKRLACDVARYYLYDDHATETVQKRYDAAIAFFRDVAAGKVTLGPEANATRPAGGSVHMVSGERVFSRSARG